MSVSVAPVFATPRDEFRALLESLADYFAAEPKAVSVNTEKFGTVHRDDVERLLDLANGVR